MNDRYFGKVVTVLGSYTIVMNRGSSQGVQINQKFLVVGLGEVLVDPDTQEELERLEIVRGRVVVSHVQEKISTLESCDYEKSQDTKEIKKITTRGGIASMIAPQDTVTESIKPGERHRKTLHGVEVGDCLIKL